MKQITKILKKLIFLNLILGLVFSCETKQGIKEKNIHVYFKGDSTFLKKINFSFFDGTTAFTSGNSTMDSTGNLNFYLPESITRYGSLLSVGINKRIIISHNDTIQLNLEQSDNNKNVYFNGRNAQHYNTLDSILHFTTPDYSGDINNYKKTCKKVYNKKKEYLLKYSKNHTFSKDFYKIINLELQSEYFIALIRPLINNKIIKNEIPKNYFEEVDLKFFNNKSILKSRKGTLALSYYLRNYFTEPALKFSHEKFYALEQYIEDNFKGQTKEYALMWVLNIYNNNLLPSNIELLKSKINIYKKDFVNLKYIEKIKEIEEKLSVSNSKLPDSILNIRISSLDDSQLIISDLLKPDTILVFDIWASWCYWCLYDMELTKNFKNNLIDNEKVEWIYLSIDKKKDTPKWKKFSNEKKELGLLKNQYLIDERDFPKFSTFFNTDEAIPKYIFLDKKGFLVLPDGPRPTDSLLFKRAVKQLN